MGTVGSVHKKAAGVSVDATDSRIKGIVNTLMKFIYESTCSSGADHRWSQYSALQ